MKRELQLWKESTKWSDLNDRVLCAQEMFGGFEDTWRPMCQYVYGEMIDDADMDDDVCMTRCPYALEHHHTCITSESPMLWWEDCDGDADVLRSYAYLYTHELEDLAYKLDK